MSHIEEFIEVLGAFPEKHALGVLLAGESVTEELRNLLTSESHMEELRNLLAGTDITVGCYGFTAQVGGFVQFLEEQPQMREKYAEEIAYITRCAELIAKALK